MLSKTNGEGGFSLFEMIIVMGLLIVVMGLASKVFINAHVGMKREIAWAEARAAVGRASRKLLRDIRSAAYANGGVEKLLLSGTDGSQVVWYLMEGRLVRSNAEGETVFNALITRMRVNVEKHGSYGFVEVGIEVKDPDRSRTHTIYVAGCPRAGRTVP